jgi:hypothetical protein
MRRCKLASHFLTMSTGFTSVTTGLFLCTYSNASPVSLSVPIDVLLQVFRRLRQLNERSQERDPTGSVSSNCSTVDMQWRTEGGGGGGGGGGRPGRRREGGAKMGIKAQGPGNDFFNRPTRISILSLSLISGIQFCLKFIVFKSDCRTHQ